MVASMRPGATPLFLLALTACVSQPVAQANRELSPLTPPEIARGFELRDRYGLPKHLGRTAIYVDSVSVHHIYYEGSTIVWKDDAGKWHFSQATEQGPGGLLTVERKLMSHKTRTLTAAEARALERLIEDPELYDGRVRQTPPTGIGAPRHVMWIVTPFGRTTVAWDGRLLGKSGAVADIVLGRD